MSWQMDLEIRDGVAYWEGTDIAPDLSRMATRDRELTLSEWLDRFPDATVLPVFIRPASRVTGWLQRRARVFVADPNGNVTFGPATL